MEISTEFDRTEDGATRSNLTRLGGTQADVHDMRMLASPGTECMCSNQPRPSIVTSSLTWSTLPLTGGTFDSFQLQDLLAP